MENFNQLCIWPGTTLGNSTPADLEQFFLEKLDVRVKYHTQVETLPDTNPDGSAEPETGGRNDLFFFIHDEDVMKFAVPRLNMGIRWWEDVIKYNDNSRIYTPEFLEANPTTW